MKIINLTAHEVTVANGFLHITFPPSGTVVRVEASSERNMIDYDITPEAKLKLPVYQSSKAIVKGLPDEEDGVYYIVSSFVAQTVRRKDLLAPLTDNSADRDKLGNVLSVKGFQQYCELELMEG